MKFLLVSSSIYGVILILQGKGYMKDISNLRNYYSNNNNNII